MKKKILSISLAILVLAQALFFIVPASAADGAWTGTEATAFAGGSGTADDPYQIANGAQLAYLAAQVNGGTDYSGKFFRLTDDIDLENREWLVIGNAHDKPFKGAFDGNGKTISGLLIAETKPYNAALFGKVMGSTAVIKNLTVNGKITGKVNSGAFVPAIAAVCGSLYTGASMENVTVYADIAVKDALDYYFVAGLAGYVQGGSTVKNCRTYGSISVTNGSTGLECLVGGVIGRARDCMIVDCINYAKVSSTRVNATTASGGIVGATYYAGGDPDDTVTIKRCINYGEIFVDAGTGNYRAGGMVGNSGRWGNNRGYIVIESCVNIGNLSGKGITSAGGANGMIGFDESKKTTINNCIAVNSIISKPARLSTVVTNCVTGLSVDTLDGARVRIAQPTGIRFDSTVSKAAYNSLKDMGADVTLGTLIAPTQRVAEAGAFTREALDALSASLSGTPTYQTVVFTPGTSSWVETDNEELYGFSGALAKINSENYNLGFSAVGYITVTLGELTFTLYADYNGEAHRTRSIAYTAKLAYDDRTETADATHTVYVEADGNYSPYSAEALAIIKGFADQYVAG